MNIPEPLATLIHGKSEARRRRLAEAKTRHADLQRQYRDALERGDDDEADKIAAKLRKAMDDMSAAQLAVDTDRELVEAQERAAAEKDGASKAAELNRRIEAHMAASEAFEKLVQTEVLTAWCAVEEAQQAMHEAARAARVSAAEIGVQLANDVWARVWIRYLQDVERGRGQHRAMPIGLSPSKSVETVASLNAKFRHDRAARDQKA